VISTGGAGDPILQQAPGHPRGCDVVSTTRWPRKRWAAAVVAGAAAAARGDNRS